MYQIIKDGTAQKWLTIKNGKLIEVDTFKDFSEAYNVRKRMEEVYKENFEIIEK